MQALWHTATTTTTTNNNNTNNKSGAEPVYTLQAWRGVAWRRSSYRYRPHYTLACTTESEEVK